MARNMQIPSGWRLVRLEGVAETIMGQSPPGDTVFDWNGDDRSNDGLPFIQGNAEFGIKFPSPLKWCARPAKVAVPGDILISVRAPVGQTNRADRQLGIGRGLAAIRFGASTKTFGWHVINHVKGTLERVTQGSTFKAIGGKDLRNLRIPFPPLPEQRAIAAVLDSIDEAIEHTEAVITATERLRESLLHELLTHGVPGWHTEWKEVRGIGTIPTDWKVARLGDMATYVGSGVTPRGGRSAYQDSGVKFIRSQNVHFDGLKLDDVAYISTDTDEAMRRSRVLSGDVLLNITGASIGRCTVAPSELGRANVNQHVCIIRPHECANPNFISEWLGTPQSQREIDEVQIGQSRQGLNYQQVRALTIARPSRHEQDEIAKLTSSIRKSTQSYTEQSTKLEVLRTSVADAVLTGRLRVTV